MSAQDLGIVAIYNSLFAEQTVAVELESVSAFRTFRAKLFSYKAKQDQILFAVDLIETKMQLRIERKDLEGGGVIALCSFVAPDPAGKQARTYKVVIFGSQDQAKEAVDSLLTDIEEGRI